MPPRRESIANTANVCRVNGTVVGMLIHEHTAISAAPRAIYAISSVLNADSFVVNVLVLSILPPCNTLIFSPE